MAKRRSDSKRLKPTHTADASFRDSATGLAESRWPALLVLMCFFARWLVPTEGALLGKTLWLVGATFLCVAIFCSCQARRLLVKRIQFGVLDATVTLLALAHVISALVVLTTTGQKRFAMTMLWEWTAVAVQFFALRQVLVDRVNQRTLRNVMLSLLIAISGYGVYQHWVEHPSQVAEYTQIRKQINDIPATNRTAEQERTLRDLTAKLLAEQVPMEGPSRELFERRLRDSSEPFGFFALANTYGGFMALLVVLLLIELVPNESGTSRLGFGLWLKRQWPWVLALLAAFYCLLLTKSRSAFLATIAGTAVFGLQSLRARLTGNDWRRLMLVAVVVLTIASVVVGVGFATGSLDMEIISEAPKSLLYRIQYWTGTAKVIQENPWFGVGPGNFRGHYLKHKLPEASEEIADPHQYVLDVFANSGLLGVLAVLFLTGLFLKSLLRSPKQSLVAEVAVPESSLANCERGFSAMTIVVTTVVVFVWQWVIDARTNSALLVTGLVASLIAARLDQQVARIISGEPNHVGDTSHDRSAATWGVFCGSAAAVIFTHLLVAGGIAFSAVNLTLFTLVAISITPPFAKIDPTPTVETPEEFRVARRTTCWQACSVACVVFGVCSLLIGLGPVLRSQTALHFGDYLLATRGDVANARSEYLAAADADPLAPEPHLSLAQLSFRSSQNGHEEKYFVESINHARDAVARDPHSRIAQHLIAKWYAVRFAATSDAKDADESVRWFEETLAGFPTHPIWNAEYALALRAANKPVEATRQAEKTLALEKTNRDYGHADRYLAKELLKSMQGLSGTQAN